tara:strand:+ start:107 stop:985 length:879 start_codon:yes stop_codon:yes gene_type:complete
MATLYKNRNTWYIAVSHDSKRITRSLKTRDIKTAKKLKPAVELRILNELIGNINQTKNLPFKDIVHQFLSSNPHWAKRTKELYTQILNAHISSKPLPSHPTTRAIHTRTINVCWNWAVKNDLTSSPKQIKGDTKGIARQRVLTDNERNILFNSISNKHFNLFVRFAYYTGARSGEIRRLTQDKIFNNYVLVSGKTGSRMVKINSQAKEILCSTNQLWSYSKDYVSHQFKSEARGVGIDDIRFHDLRRTFGYNLIKQGKPIYEVSKLLGHSSVVTTERHYAPLLVVDIQDFKL